MAELKAKGTEKGRATYVRHGMPADKVLGVSIADLKPIAKALRGKQSVAMDLYATGVMDAMYLAGMVADGRKMTVEQLQTWVDAAAGMSMVAEYAVPWVVLDHPRARELALDWIGSGDPHRANVGWTVYSGLVATKADADLDLEEIRGLLRKAVADVHGAENRLKLAMNSFVISVGCYVVPLHGDAVRAAEQIGKVTADMGQTACKVPDAVAYIAKVESTGRRGKKRATMRC